MQDTIAANPLREGLSAQQAPEPCALVIFGATGDLTHRKLVPALYNLAHEGQLPQSFAIVGFARRPKTHDQFRTELRDAVAQFSRFQPVNPAVWDALAQAIFYHQSEFADPKGYKEIWIGSDTNYDYCYANTVYKRKKTITVQSGCIENSSSLSDVATSQVTTAVDTYMKLDITDSSGNVLKNVLQVNGVRNP